MGLLICIGGSYFCDDLQYPLAPHMTQLLNIPIVPDRNFNRSIKVIEAFSVRPTEKAPTQESSNTGTKRRTKRWSPYEAGK